jgi:hypothetical protein
MSRGNCFTKLTKNGEGNKMNLTISKRTIFIVIGVILLAVIAFTVVKGFSQSGVQGTDLSNSAPDSSTSSTEQSNVDPYAGNIGTSADTGSNTGVSTDINGVTTSETSLNGGTTGGSASTGSGAIVGGDDGDGDDDD